MRINWLLLAVLTAAGAQSATAADGTPDWAALAAADIQAAYSETRDNHPGMYDPANPGFTALLDQARDEALVLAAQADTPAGFEASLRRFKAVLNDGHAGAYAQLPEQYQPNIRWPGFVAAWRGNAMYVYKSADGGPPPGAEITTCDGKPVRDLVRQNVFGFAAGVDAEGEWWSTARRLFVDDGNPFVSLPKVCDFTHSGTTQKVTLSWSAIPDYYQQWRNGSANGERLPIGMNEPAPGIFWIALPDFQPDDAGTAAYLQLYSDVEARRVELQGARAIVLDLRFNEGGSSNWSKMLSERLWGKGRVTAALKDYMAATQTWWRPTPGNLKEVNNFIGLLEAQGDAETAALVKQFIPMFENAIAKGDRFLVEPDIPTSDPASAQADPPALNTPVYVVVPGQCASACLNAIDQFKRFPNTKLIGAPSSSDSTYMEVRSAPLPSGMASAIIPMKMYVDRPRGKGAIYVPDIEMRDFDWSTANFLTKIEADLAP